MTETKTEIGPIPIADEEQSPNLPEEAHISLDLETLGTQPGCVILSIGATAFDPTTGDIEDGSFYAVLNAAEQLRAGATVSADTIAWWMDQTEEVKDEILPALRSHYADRMTPVPGVLAAFADWCDSKAKRVVVWGNGPSFDNGILSALYDKVGLKQPWSYWNEGCVRTAVRLASLTGWVKPDHYAEFVAHNAMHDSRYQAQVVCSAIAHLNKFGIEVDTLQKV